MIRNIYPLTLISAYFFNTILFLNANSQVQINGSKFNTNPPAIESKQLLGEWISIDSSRHKIEFVESVLGIELKTGGSNPYYFSKDSLGQVSSSGFFPNWPPFDCDLFFISRDTLKVTYSQMGDIGTSFLYVKKTNE